MGSYFQLSETSSGQFKFSLKSDQDKTLLQSEQYTSKSSRDGGVASVKSNCADEKRYALETASDGRFYFNLKAGNGQIIGTSTMYATEQDRTTAIDIVKLAADAPVKD